MKRFFVQEKLGQNFNLTGAEHHHLASVVRCKVGDKVIVTNGDEFDYKYQIDTITRDHAGLSFLEKIKNRCNPSKILTVYLGLIRLENVSMVVKKLNELGVSRIIPFLCERSNIDKRAIDIQKLTAIAQQSCKQCGRSIPLQVGEVITFNQLAKYVKLHDYAFYADRGEKTTRIRTDALLGQNTALVIGPEGGLTLNENLTLATAATPVTLGRRTLRSETAAIVASTLILSVLGEL